MLSVSQMTSPTDSPGVEGCSQGERYMGAGDLASVWDTLAVVKTETVSEPLPSLLLKGQTIHRSPDD